MSDVKSPFLEQLQQGLMLGDGAMGTLLYERGVPFDSCYEALNLDNPDLIRQIHRDYLHAGARLIETNTFGANRLKLEKYGLATKVNEINQLGAKLAREISHGGSAFVAGSVGPLLPNPAPGPEPAHKTELYGEQIESLTAAGVDLLFLETFNSLAEIKLALQAARTVTALPVIASLSFSDDGHTTDGFRISEAFVMLREHGADVVGINCHTGPLGAERLLQELTVGPGDLISVFPNAGRPQFYEGRYLYHPTPHYFAECVPKLVAQGARLIGGCCGTSPETIRAMAEPLRRSRPITRKAGITLVEPIQRAEPALPRPPESLLEAAKRRCLIVTELDPPKAIQLEKMIEGAAALKQAGTDFVTMADNSLAILRVSNMATAQVVRERAGVDSIIHLACRDRNLIGLQSELMGLHTLGFHHVLALTGDPAKMGDHPDATSVYDLNSIGLIRTMKRLNEGFAANGRDLKGKTQFVIGCALNPNAKNFDSQLRKLDDKLDAGAQFVMTQPIFDGRMAKMIAERTQSLDVPVLVGVMPLLSARNTEFLHNEVPGISIPDTIRDRMRGKEGTAGSAEGLAVARELCDAVLQHFRGLYLITPLLRFDLTVELSCSVRAWEKSTVPSSSAGS